MIMCHGASRVWISHRYFWGILVAHSCSDRVRTQHLRKDKNKIARGWILVTRDVMRFAWRARDKPGSQEAINLKCFSQVRCLRSVMWVVTGRRKTCRHPQICNEEVILIVNHRLQISTQRELLKTSRAERRVVGKYCYSLLIYSLLIY